MTEQLAFNQRVGSSYVYMKSLRLLFLISLLADIGCNSRANQTTNANPPQLEASRAGTVSVPANQPPIQNPGKLIHIVVALCDNQYQGIVPVPARIGNGDDPDNNLYWGAAFGVKNYFKKSNDWTTLIDLKNPRPPILERIIFKHKARDVYIVADAYRGREIKQTTVDFLRFASGTDSERIDVEQDSKRLALNAGAGADLIVYVGHDGLMDFSLSEYPQRADERGRDVIILACASKSYFRDAIRKSGAHPLLWTTGLMAPEAYVLKSAIDGWVLGEDGERVRKRAAEAYNLFQRCGVRSALNLFSTGW